MVAVHASSPQAVNVVIGCVRLFSTLHTLKIDQSVSCSKATFDRISCMPSSRRHYTAVTVRTIKRFPLSGCRSNVFTGFECL